MPRIVLGMIHLRRRMDALVRLSMSDGRGRPSYDFVLGQVLSDLHFFSRRWKVASRSQSTPATHTAQPSAKRKVRVTRQTFLEGSAEVIWRTRRMYGFFRDGLHRCLRTFGVVSCWP